MRLSDFNEVFLNYYQALCSFSRRYISDLDTVEDIVQEIFIVYWEKHREHFNKNTIRAYLYTAVRNQCLNYLKHREVLAKNQHLLLHELESEQFFQKHVLDEEVFNQLYREIKKLPDAAQQIMLLALNGLKNQEIADELDISINTVKTQKKIAYNRLKEKLDPLLSLVLLAV